MPDLSEQDKATILNAVKEASEILLDFRQRYLHGYELKIEQKEDGSYVTEADYASNEIIVSSILNQFPGDGILSEELPRDPSLSGKERLWILDPLDGTHSFIDKLDDFSILLAMAINGQVEFSIMLFPAKGLLAVAEKGGGVELNQSKISVSKSDSIRSESIYTRSTKLTDDSKRYPERFRFR